MSPDPHLTELPRYDPAVTDRTVAALWALVSGKAWATVLSSLANLTKEMETLTEEIRELREEVAKEGDEDRASAEREAALNAKVDALEAQLAEVQPLIDAARAGEADALAQLEELLAAVRQAIADLRADNAPDSGGDGGDPPHPDNTLPTGGDANTGGDHVDNSLPGDQPYPDIGGPGDQPVVNPLNR